MKEHPSLETSLQELQSQWLNFDNFKLIDSLSNSFICTASSPKRHTARIRLEQKKGGFFSEIKVELHWGIMYTGFQTCGKGFPKSTSIAPYVPLTAEGILRQFRSAKWNIENTTLEKNVKFVAKSSSPVDIPGRKYGSPEDYLPGWCYFNDLDPFLKTTIQNFRGSEYPIPAVIFYALHNANLSSKTKTVYMQIYLDFDEVVHGAVEGVEGGAHILSSQPTIVEGKASEGSSSSMWLLLAAIAAGLLFLGGKREE